MLSPVSIYPTHPLERAIEHAKLRHPSLEHHPMPISASFPLSDCPLPDSEACFVIGVCTDSWMDLEGAWDVVSSISGEKMAYIPGSESHTVWMFQSDTTFYAVLQPPETNASEFEHFRAMLYLFSVCHIVLYLSPPRSHVIRTMRIMQRAKDELVSKARERMLPVSYLSWPGQCVPVLIFVDDNVSPQGQIRAILRKSNIGSHVPASLFFTDDFLSKDDEDASHLNKHKTREIGAVRSGSPGAPLFSLCHRVIVRNGSCVNVWAETKDSLINGSHVSVPDNELLTVVHQVSDMLRNSMEFPSCSQWFTSSCLLQETIIHGLGFKSLAPFEAIAASLDPIHELSVSSSENALKDAQQVYSMDLPAMYTEAEHSRRVGVAITCLHDVVVGPVMPSVIDQLVKSCENVWKDRKKCDSVSMAGNVCIRACHDDTPIKLILDGFPDHGHTSGFEETATCNCGRTQWIRPDPFSHREANIHFYEAASRQCCHTLTSYHLKRHSVVDGSDPVEWSLRDEQVGGEHVSDWWLGHCGEASEYHDSMDMCTDQPGWVSGHAALNRWTIVVERSATGEATFHSVKGESSAAMNKVEPLTRNDGSYAWQLTSFIGIEYECTAGHRFIAPSSTLIPYDSPCALVLECPVCQKQAHLTRIWITTPPALPRRPVRRRGNVVLRASTATSSHVPRAIILPRLSFICLRVPRLFHGDASVLNEGPCSFHV